jgi:hypothetical protein
MTLRAMLGEPLPTTPRAYEALDICLNRLNKFETFGRIVTRILPDLPKDHEELDNMGASRNLNSAEFGAIIEAMLCELYGVCDGLREFLTALYRKVRGVQNKSNEKLFRRAEAREYGPEFPEPIREALAEAYRSWFPRLRELRRQIVHAEGGFFHLNSETCAVAYWHGPTVGSRRRQVIEDVTASVRDYDTQVRQLLETVAIHFLAQLAPKPRMYPCGTYLARMYLRMVAPVPDLSFQSGYCASWDWFEKEPEFFCPLAKQCSAYQHKWPGGYAAAVAAQ